MNSFETMFPIDLYHSYVVEGDPNETPILLRNFLEMRGDILVNSPDMLYQTYDSFGVDDSLQIKEWHSKRGVNNGKKVCIISAKFINREAEQSLLKIIEEPQMNTHFFLVLPNASILQDTMLSRVHIIKTVESENIDNSKNAKAFLALSPSARIEVIADMIKKHKDSIGSGNLRFDAIELINGLEKLIYEKFKFKKKDDNIQSTLNDLAMSRTYLETPGASVKMILEHIALVL